jgi:hypothetical protein
MVNNAFETTGALEISHATSTDIHEQIPITSMQLASKTMVDVEASLKLAVGPGGSDRLEQLRRDHGVRKHHSPMTITINLLQSTWTSTSDPKNPFNWPSHRKFIIGMIFSFGQLIPIMSASMIAAALGNIAHDLKISASTAQITLSSYFLGMAFAPFLIAAMSEMYGRKRVWVACNAWYILWNTLCPVGNSAALMIVGRVMTGAGASVGVTVSSVCLLHRYLC